MLSEPVMLSVFFPPALGLEIRVNERPRVCPSLKKDCVVRSQPTSATTRRLAAPPTRGPRVTACHGTVQITNHHERDEGWPHPAQPGSGKGFTVYTYVV